MVGVETQCDASEEEEQEVNESVITIVERTNKK